MAVTLERDPTSEGEGEVAAPRRRAWVVWLGVAVGLVGCLVLLPAAEGEPGGGTARIAARWLLEPWLVLGLLCWVLRRVPVRRIVSPGQSVLVGAVVVGTLAAQSLPMLNAYPLTDWSMYSSPTDSLRYTEFGMVDAQGRPVADLPIADLVPNTLGRAFMDRLSEWVERAEDGDGQAVEVVEATLIALLAEVDDPSVAGVDVRWCYVEAPTPQEPARCELALSVDR